MVREEALAAGADAAVVSNHWAKGGEGAKDLAEAVIAICEGESNFKYLYDLNLSIEEKIAIIGREIYGADGIELSDLARQQIDTYTRQGYAGLPSMFINMTYRALANFLDQSVWQRHNIPSRTTLNSRVCQRASHCPFVQSACLQVLASFTPSWETCKPCQALAHDQVISPTFKSLIVSQNLFRLLGSRSGQGDWQGRRFILKHTADI